MQPKTRLDVYLVKNEYTTTRSQAESWIRLGKVTVNNKVQTKPGFFVPEGAKVILSATEHYVSRAGLKLASVAEVLRLSFDNKVILDVGSSTGGFTDYALQHGAKKVVAVDVGTDQLHPSLRNDKRIELHEKTDIRDFKTDQKIDIVVIDVSFISLREILPAIIGFTTPSTQIVAMVKPQFEAGKNMTNSGVIKNDSVRRKILKEFELWSRQYFLIVDKADSEVAGAHGNRERFYLLKKLS